MSNQRLDLRANVLQLTSVSIRLLTIASLFGSVIVSIVFAGSQPSAKAIDGRTEERPNILFIMSDDHGYQAIGAYGSVVNQTPNLDRIASDGMRFDRCFVTNSICGPCRAVILTGKYSHLNGFARNGDRFNGDQQNVAKILRANGYNTAVIGKWHLASTPTGFDYYHVLKGQGPYYNPVMSTPDGDVQHTGYTTDIITDEALEWLKEKRDPAKPFFMMYHHKAPHRNWQPGPKYLNKYDDVEIPEPETLFDDYSGRGTAAKTQAMTVAEHLTPHDLKLASQRANFTPEQKAAWDAAYSEKNQAFEGANLTGKDLIRWKYQRYAKDYLRCVDSVDENVGRVLDYLDETGLAENTLVIYTSDQGWYLGEHGWYDKRWMYEESFRTPLLVRWPGHVEPGTTNEDFVMNLDFAETFLQVAGIDIPEDMQGEGLQDVLEGKTPEDWRDSVYYHYYEFPGPHSVRRHLGVRTKRYKLIHYYRIDEWELFDLEKDPNELQSVYDDPEYAEVVDELKVELERLKTKYQDDGTVVDFGAEKAKEVPTSQALQFSKESETELDGTSLLDRPSSELDPTYKPIVLGGWCKLTDGNGVFVAEGGGGLGFSLYFREGKPHFAIRNSGQVRKVAGAPVPLNEWVHVAAELNSDGAGRIYVNGEPSGEPASLGFVSQRPQEGLSIGVDSGSTVHDEEKALPLKGAIKDVRLYWGPLNRDALMKWATADDAISLFNGESLEGWEVLSDRDYKKHGEVQVDDGSIILTKGNPGTGIRYSEAVPNINYEIRLDAKRTEGSDIFCGLTFPVREEFLTLIIGGWGGGVTGISNLDGMSAVENQTTGYTEFQQDRWYHIRLRVTEEKVQAWLDGESILGFESDIHRHSIWWEQEPARPLGIVTWNSTAALKNLSYRRLTAK